jgi:hypothetical protein
MQMTGRVCPARMSVLNSPARHRSSAARVAILVLVGLAPGARAQEVSIDHRQAALIVRALGYEQHLPARAGVDVHIGVLGKADAPASERAALGMTLAFQALGDVAVQGLPLKASQLSYSSAEVLGNWLDRRGIDVLYVAPGLDAELAAILELTRKRHVLSVGSSEEYVVKGASLGVFAVDGSPTVFVNLEASRREGAGFSGSMLRLARIIR